MNARVFSRAVACLALLVLLLSVLFLAFSWRTMPDLIPTHFNAAGAIDGWGDKSSVLILPVIGALAVGLLLLVSFIAGSMKNTGGVRPMTAMAFMTRLQALIVALVFAYITVCSCRSVPLGRWFGPLFTGLVAAVIIVCALWACIPKRK